MFRRAQPLFGVLPTTHYFLVKKPHQNIKVTVLKQCRALPGLVNKHDSSEERTKINLNRLFDKDIR